MWMANGPTGQHGLTAPQGVDPETKHTIADVTALLPLVTACHVRAL